MIAMIPCSYLFLIRNVYLQLMVRFSSGRDLFRVKTLVKQWSKFSLSFQWANRDVPVNEFCSGSAGSHCFLFHRFLFVSIAVHLNGRFVFFISLRAIENKTKF